MTLPTLNVWGDIDENGAPNGNSIIGNYGIIVCCY